MTIRIKHYISKTNLKHVISTKKNPNSRSWTLWRRGFEGWFLVRLVRVRCLLRTPGANIFSRCFSFLYIFLSLFSPF